MGSISASVADLGFMITHIVSGAQLSAAANLDWGVAFTGDGPVMSTTKNPRSAS
jgi:hypothetical protein